MSGRFLRRSRLVMAGMALCGGVSGVALAATGGTADASTAYAIELGQIYNDYSHLVLDVGQNGVMIQDQLDGSSAPALVHTRRRGVGPGPTGATTCASPLTESKVTSFT